MSDAEKKRKDQQRIRRILGRANPEPETDDTKRWQRIFEEESGNEK